MNEDASKLEKIRRKREDELILLLLLIIAHATDAAEASPNPAEVITGRIRTIAPKEIAASMADVHIDAAAIYSPSSTSSRDELIKLYEPSAQASANAMADTMDENFVGLTDIVSIEAAMDAAGYSQSNSTAFELGAERSIVPASNSGFVAGGILFGEVTGLEHVSVLDDATTEICDERDGLMLPVDNPYWLTNWPSLHWRCRSIVRPIFGKFETSNWLPSTSPMPGFGIAPATFGRFAA